MLEKEAEKLGTIPDGTVANKVNSINSNIK